MKKWICILLVLSFSFVFCGCSDEKSASDIDVDLSILSDTVAYAEVTDILTNPTDYIGKTICAKGPYSASFFDVTGKYYHYVLFSDATACCSQGIEFLWDGHTERSDFPDDGTEITIVGTFASYDELEVTYYYIDVSSFELT